MVENSQPHKKVFLERFHLEEFDWQKNWGAIESASIALSLFVGISMAKLEDFTPGTLVDGIIEKTAVEVISAKWHGDSAVEITYKAPETGQTNSILLYRDDEYKFEITEKGRPWGFDADGSLFRLVSEAVRIRLAYLFDPLLAVHTSLVEPLPHQITAVYEEMLTRQPLRFLLADDPGAGKTIMAGLLIKELIARGDLERCLIICPGSLVEQWQDELYRRFHLPFEIMTNEKLEAAKTGNWLQENNLVIARLDKLSRDENVQEKLSAPDAGWDLVICDEAHKMSAGFYGGEINYTKRYRLGQLVSGLTRHFLLMTATPHNGKEEDFQLFMALLDGDRFEGRFRDGAHTVDVSDMMRRMVKENLYKFDSTPLFPERRAYTIPYKLSDLEATLYKEVTEYVREEFNRLEALQNDRRAGNVGFALMILQRRLASSPEAIYQSLRRRRERLESKLRELELLKRGADVQATLTSSSNVTLDSEDIEDLEDAPDDELDAFEAEILDHATAAQGIEELKAEIGILISLESSALAVRNSGEDRKWNELSTLLNDIFLPSNSNQEDLGFLPSSSQKLVVFTEHRATLDYLENRIKTLLGDEEAVVTIHGGKGREERLKNQESFRHDPRVKVLLATDAAGEGINLQRAHLMVNYDLPWNPNRIEQRFGRIHRIGQTEVCHLWNLVAQETREGNVYQTLLHKLEEARNALGGQVFDVLGKVQFDGRSLKDLMIEAIRYGERPDVKARLVQVVSDAFDRGQIQDLIEDKVLAQDAMDTSRVRKIREDMERAEVRRLQPHYIESFFLEAFKKLGGTVREREPRRYEVTRVPSAIRNRDRQIGIGEPVLRRYERICFEKDLIAVQGNPLASFVCPGHPLLSSVIDLIQERYESLLRKGGILVDENDHSDDPRMMFYLQHSIEDGTQTASGRNRVASRRMLYAGFDQEGNATTQEYAPYLDYRPLSEEEPSIDELLSQPECSWITSDLENVAISHAVAQIVPAHISEIRSRRVELIEKTEAAVKERLTREINYWDHRAAQLLVEEEAGKRNARLNSGEARRRADNLQTRLQNRMAELQQGRDLSPRPPVITGGLLVVPIGLINKMQGKSAESQRHIVDTQASAEKARKIVMEIERSLGFDPIDRETEKLGYDIESRIPDTGKLRFIEVKGRVSGANTITVTKNEILTSLNKPDDFILAIVEFMENDAHDTHYIREPFTREPDFGVVSVNYHMNELIEKATTPS